MLLDEEKKLFLLACYKLVTSKEKTDIVVLGKEGKGFFHDDDVLYVGVTEDKLNMEVIRKENGAPVIYVQDGKMLHFHGEYIFLVEHIGNLLKSQ